MDIVATGGAHNVHVKPQRIVDGQDERRRRQLRIRQIEPDATHFDHVNTQRLIDTDRRVRPCERQKVIEGVERGLGLGRPCDTVLFQRLVQS